MIEGNSKDRAIPFIVNQNGEFQVSEESKTFLRSLHGKKVGVVCVVGKYRTGKSYFLNKVILNRATDTGFNVGPTVNPCTKVRLLKVAFSVHSLLRTLMTRDSGFGARLSRRLSQTEKR